MKQAIASLLILCIYVCAAVGCVSCSVAKDGTVSTTIGDGVFDAREQAYFRVLVGAALTSYPGTAPHVYEVTSAILAVVNASDAGDNTSLMSLINVECAKIHVKPALQPSFDDLVALLQADMFSVLDGNAIAKDNRLEIVKQMLTIINESAKARMVL